MSIRKEALCSNAFQQLNAAYENREKAAETWKARGKKVVGVLGADVPEELLLAADLMPYPIYGEPEMDLTETNQYLEFAFPLTVRAQFGKILAGTNRDIMDYLVISNSTDAMVRIYYYIREMKQLEPERKISELYFIDWLFTRFRMHQIRNEETLEKFRNTLSDWIGRKITDEQIKAAAVVCNENREALKQIGALRRQGKVTGTEALTIIGAGFYMDKKEHTRLVCEVAAEAESWPEVNGVPLFVTGSPQEHRDFYEQVEAWGGNVVSEDHDWGDRYWNRDVNTQIAPIKSIVDRYMLRQAGTKRAFVSERTEAVCEAVQACGAGGMISYTYQYDDAPSWDFPKQAKALEKTGVKALQLSGQPYSVKNNSKAENAVKQLIAQVKGA